MTKTIMILAIAAAFVAGSIGTASIVTAQSDVITACVNDKSQGKDLRIVDSADDCRNNESVLQWNEQGPAGEDGADGTNGTNGEDGADGEDGAPGEGGSQTLDYNQRSINLDINNPRGTVLCPAGYIATGFGFTGNSEAFLLKATPRVDGSGYFFEAGFDTDIGRIFAHVNCVNLQ